jgi:hypothetical protein
MGDSITARDVVVVVVQTAAVRCLLAGPVVTKARNLGRGR